MFWVGFSLRFDSNTGVIFKGGGVHGLQVLGLGVGLGQVRIWRPWTNENDIFIGVETSGKTNPKHRYIRKTTEQCDNPLKF